jgi:hypothetical protein
VFYQASFARSIGGVQPLFTALDAARACLVDLDRGTGGMIASTTGTPVLTCLRPDSVRVAL